MEAVVATSKLIEKRGDLVTRLENSSLVLKKKLAKERLVKFTKPDPRKEISELILKTHKK